MADLVGATAAWRRVDGIHARRTTRSVLVMLPGASEPLRLEGAAAFVWDELEEPAGDAQLLDAIASRFGRPGDDLRADVVAACAALRESGVIVRRDG